MIRLRRYLVSNVLNSFLPPLYLHPFFLMVLSFFLTVMMAARAVEFHSGTINFCIHDLQNSVTHFKSSVPIIGSSFIFSNKISLTFDVVEVGDK